jgi:hypothetical protein
MNPEERRSKRWGASLRSRLGQVAVAVLIAVGLYAAIALDFHIWRLKHPEAPWWTWLL